MGGAWGILGVHGGALGRSLGSTGWSLGVHGEAFGDLGWAWDSFWGIHGVALGVPRGGQGGRWGLLFFQSVRAWPKWASQGVAEGGKTHHAVMFFHSRGEPCARAIPGLATLEGFTPLPPS